MIDPERIQRLAAKLGNRSDALEFVRQMRCGGRKFDGGGRYFRTNLQDESPMSYEPMMPVYPEVSVPERYYPQPNYGDYEYPVSTGMIQSMPIQVNAPVSAPMTGVLADEVSVPVPDLFSDEAKARRRLKQRYAESRFNDSAVSGAGAMGAWQIMPITLNDYLGRGRGKKGDINNAEYNGRIRDWVMGIIPRDLQEFWSEDDSDINKLAKLYAAYNWGAGSLRSYFRKRQKEGKSIDDPYEWVEGLNPETRRYVKYLAFDEDFDEKTGYTTRQFEDAARSRGYMAEGGRIHIKPENRGKFTALKKRTGHSASWFKAHGTPAQKKMAVFALNAKKWKHGDGGPLDKYGDDAVRLALSKLKANRFQDGGDSGEKKSIWKLHVRVPNMTGTATAAATGLRDIPLTDSTIGRELAVAGTAIASPLAGHLLNVLGNPALAYTDYGAALASLADSYGIVEGMNGVSGDIGKAASGKYGANDIPHTVLSGMAAMPGVGLLSDVGNIGKAVEIGRNISYIPDITTKETLANRIAHPLETYRFANVARRAENVLPQDIYRQSIGDLSRGVFYNHPRPGEAPGYWFLNRAPAKNKIGVVHGYDSNAGRWIDPEFYGLGDPNATNLFSRGHEFGHLVSDAAEKLGYYTTNFPPVLYQYNPGESIMTSSRPGRIMQEYFSDVVGNAVSDDMALDKVRHVVEHRYPYVKGKVPGFRKK